MSDKLKNRFTTDNLLLLFILVVAAILRFWNFSEMPFMHDELSGLIRAQADSFSEIIQKIKETDVHPVGIPVFIHYWTLMLGKGEIIVKLPFILAGLFSIYYSYRVAEKWFNTTVALLTVAFMATLQFSVMYHQLARPYASGMLFSVIMVWCWTNFFFGEESKQNKNLFGFVIAASLCSYNHYFSLLFAGIVGITGVFFLNKQNVWKYLLAGILIAVLFVPHLSVFLYHLSIGGAEEDSWLKKPDTEWFIVFTRYLFHYSFLVYILVLMLVIGSIFYFNKTKPVFYKMRVISLVWGLLPFLIAYYYSVHKNPVLQFSTMTFSLPFLLMFIFSFYTELSKSIKSALVTIVLLVNTCTLFAVRKHHKVFYKQPYEQMAKMSVDMIKEKGEKNVSIAHYIFPEFMDYYFEKYNFKYNFLRVENTDTKSFQAFVNSQTTDFFVAGGLPLEYLAIIKERYPYALKKDEGFTYSVYCFSKNKIPFPIADKIVFSNSISTSFYKTDSLWKGSMNLIKDSIDRKEICLYLDSTQEYSTAFVTKLKDITDNRHNIVNITARINSSDTLGPVLVFNIFDKDQSLVWSGTEYYSFNGEVGKYRKIYLSQLLSGFDFEKYPDAGIKIYVWNRNKKNILIKDITIEVIESNPFIYALYEPLE